MFNRLFAPCAIVLLAASAAPAQTPLGTAFTYQGQLKSSGNLASGSYNIAFRLFNVPSGGSQIGNPVALNGVAVQNGLFTVVLNAGGEFGGSAFNGERRWLEIAISGMTLAPRQEIEGTPYAGFAARPWSTNGNAISYVGGNVGIGTGAPNTPLHIGNLDGLRIGGVDSGGYLVGSDGDAGGGEIALAANRDRYGNFINPARPSWYMRVAPKVDDFNIFRRAGAGSPNVSLFRLTGDGMLQTGAIFASAVNAFTGNTSGTAVVGFAGATTGAAGGVEGSTHAPDGYGVHGIAFSSSGSATGGRFETFSPQGRGVWSTNNATTGSAYGVFGHTRSTDGFAVFGDATAASGFAAGGGFQTSSTGGRGVDGIASATSGANFGGHFQTNSTSGTAMYGLASATSGVNYGGSFRTNSPVGTGVYGLANATTGTSYGGYFQCNSPTGYAASFQGRVVTSSDVFIGGNVGIGTANPLTALHVKGSLLVEDNFSAKYATLDVGDSPSFPGELLVAGETVTLATTVGGPRTRRVIIRNDGNVGIGTTAPTQSLDVAGNIRSRGGDFILNGRGGGFGYNGGAGRALVDAGDGSQLGIAGLIINFGNDFGQVLIDGNVGIGTAFPNERLTVNGNANKPGGGPWASFSDLRLKRDVQPLCGALDQLLALRGVTFEYINPKAINEPPGRRIGMVAQEVEPHFPDWVSCGASGYKSLSYSGFEALTVEALRDLRVEKDRQLAERDVRMAALHTQTESQIEQLRNENADLRARLARIEAWVARSSQQTAEVEP